VVSPPVLRLQNIVAEAQPVFPPLPAEYHGNYIAYYAKGPRLHEYLREMNREVLSKYEGAYALQGPGGRPGEFVVELVGNELTMRPPAGGRQTLVPESSTVFYVTGQRLEFFLDAGGRPTHFVLTIVEGDMKAVRKN